MSLFRIVGNYYEDILEYFTQEYKKKYPSFEPKNMEKLINIYRDGNHSELQSFKAGFYELFETNDQYKKTEIIQLLSSTFRKLDKLKNADLAYWESRTRNASSLYTMIIIIIIIVSLLFVYLVIVNINKNKEETGIVRKLKIVISYVLVYTFILVLFVLLAMNSSDNKKISHQIRASHDSQFQNLNIQLVPNIQLQMMFTAIGYYAINDTKTYERIVKAIKKKQERKNQSSESNDTTCTTNITSKVIGDYINNNDPCKNKADLHTIYDSLKSSIAEYCFNFYNYGRGYTTLRSLVVKTSTIFMLKEVRGILNFYYYLLNKKGDVDIEKLTMENKKIIIDKFIISRLQTIDVTKIGKVSDKVDESYYMKNENFEFNEEKKDALANEDSAFLLEIKTLDIALKYLGCFLYPLYLRLQADDPNISSDVKLFLPQNIPLTVNDTFKKEIKTYFKVKLKERYSEFLSAIQMSNDIAGIFSVIIQEFDDYIIPYIKNAILKTKGDILLPIDRSYTKWRMTVDKESTNEYNKDPFNKFPDTYKNLFSEAVVKALFPKITKSILSDVKTSGDNFKVAMIANDIASKMISYKINIREHKTYIIDTLLEKYGKGVQQNTITILENILSNLEKSIEVKKNVREISDKTNPRFVDVSEFTKRIDDIVIDDFIDGIDAEYLYDLMKSFYNEVSGAVGSSSTLEPQNFTEYNIFQKKQRQMVRTRKLLHFAIALIIQGYILYLIYWFDDLKYLYANINSITTKVDGTTERIVQQMHWLNIFVKLILVTLGMIFIIALLNSYFKKQTDIFEFNRETIEINTSNLLSSITQLNNKIHLLKGKTVKKPNIRIKDAYDEFTNEEKTNLYKILVQTIESYEKCNYIINVSRSSLPFPYTDITVNSFMMLLTFFAVIYVMGKMQPIKRLKTIKELYELQSDSLYTSDEELQQQLEVMIKCSNLEIDTIAFTLKVVFYSFIIMFLIFYINTIIQSSGDFKNGLYNSGYYEEQRCYNG